MRIWRHFLGRTEPPLVATAIAALASAGVGTYAIDAGAPSGAGVLFFDGNTSQVSDVLANVSRGGIERVLAVYLGACVVESGGWRLLDAGASDVFVWGQSPDPAREIALRFKRWQEIDDLVRSPVITQNLVGQSAAWTLVLRQIVEAARFTDAPVLILGESGTGKELAARLIHTLDVRPQKRDLVILDCTTIVPELSGSEFYGHERGAFTGAVSAREGAFTLADGGTLFLDEVGELPLTLQAGLLRVVQEGTHKAVGSNVWKRASVRLVCATNRELLEEEAQGRFRRDFYYRIASWTCRLPPLRERTQDVLPLVHHFIGQLRPGKEPLELDNSVSEYLLTRDYPGNVRTLRKLVERMVSRHVGDGRLTVGDVPFEERPSPEARRKSWRDGPFDDAIRRALTLGVGLKEIGRAAEDTAERIAIDEEQGNLKRAAVRLQVTGRALQMRRAHRRGQ